MTDKTTPLPLAEDPYKSVTREDVSEHNPKMLAEWMRALQREMRDGFTLMAETFGSKILTTMERIETTMGDVVLRVNQLERAHLSLKDRVALLERHPLGLPPARIVTRRKPPRKPAK